MRLALAAPFAALFATLFAGAGTLSGQVSAPPFQIVIDSLPAATTGTLYLEQLTTIGGACQGTGTANSNVLSGALPPGLFVASPAGARQWSITGIPTVSGTFTFALHLTFTLDRRTPFVPLCTDDAVKTLTIVVTPGQTPATLAVDRPQVGATYRIGHFPPSDERVQLNAGGVTSSSFTAQAATASGGAWLSVSPPSGVTPAALSLSFSPTGLSPGVYTGTVTVAPATGNPVSIAVTLSVILDSSIVLVANPASFSFSSLTGAPAPAAQTFKVTVSGDNVLFQADVSAPPNGKWLSVNPSASATPALLAISVDPKTLTPGTYNGSITLRVAGVPNSSQVIPVAYTIQNPPLVPTINPNGVVNAADLGAAIAPGAWVSIFGNTLSATTRSWRDADFVNGKLPLALDGVSVTINGTAAAVAFISATQINVLAPDDTATGLVSVQVKTSTGISDNALVLHQTAAPGLFQFRGGTTLYAAGTHADGSYLAGAALVQQGIRGTPAKPGETIVLYGTGFGATQPPISATALVPAPLRLANPSDLRVRIGGIDAAVVFAGLITPGLYQFNVVVPPQLSDGDQTIVAELRGLLTSPSLMLTVQH